MLASAVLAPAAVSRSAVPALTAAHSPATESVHADLSSASFSAGPVSSEVMLANVSMPSITSLNLATEVVTEVLASIFTQLVVPVALAIFLYRKTFELAFGSR